MVFNSVTPEDIKAKASQHNSLVLIIIFELVGSCGGRPNATSSTPAQDSESIVLISKQQKIIRTETNPGDLLMSGYHPAWSNCVCPNRVPTVWQGGKMSIGKAIWVTLLTRLVKCYNWIPYFKKKEKFKWMWPALTPSVTLSKWWNWALDASADY